MKLTRPTSPKPFKKSAPVKSAPAPAQAKGEEVDIQDVMRMLNDVTQQNKAFAEGLSILTQKVDQIVKSVADVMNVNKEFCEDVLKEIAAISEYINIQPEEGEEQGAEPEEVEEAEEAEAAEEEGITADDIMVMKKSDIISLIEDNEIPINPADYPKVADLRKALIQYLEEEYEEDEGEAPSDTEADFEDDGEESTEEADTDDDAGENSSDDDEDDW